MTNKEAAEILRWALQWCEGRRYNGHPSKVQDAFAKAIFLLEENAENNTPVYDAPPMPSTKSAPLKTKDKDHSFLRLCIIKNTNRVNRELKEIQDKKIYIQGYKKALDEIADIVLREGQNAEQIQNTTEQETGNTRSNQRL